MRPSKIDKLLDLDRLVGLDRHALKVAVGQQHEAARFILVAFGDILPGDILAIDLRHAFVANRALIAGPEQAELDLLGFGCGGIKTTGMLTKPKLIAPFQMGLMLCDSVSSDQQLPPAQQ